MTAQILQIRDYQSAKELERMRKALEKEASEILAPFVETTVYTDTGPCETIPYGGTGIDGIWTDTDPA